QVSSASNRSADNGTGTLAAFGFRCGLRLGGFAIERAIMREMFGSLAITVTSCLVLIGPLRSVTFCGCLQKRSKPPCVIWHHAPKQRIGAVTIEQDGYAAAFPWYPLSGIIHYLFWYSRHFEICSILSCHRKRARNHLFDLRRAVERC